MPLGRLNHRWILKMSRGGWSVRDIASVYGLTPADVRRVLTPRDTHASVDAKKQHGNLRLPKPQRWVDQWRSPSDPRYSDAAGPAPAVELLEPIPTDELIDRATDAPAQTKAVMITPWVGAVNPVGSGAHPPRKITPAVLAAAIEAHAAGESWPAIAARLGCHRMALYHARRRHRSGQSLDV
jgi:hypothetical protein